MAVKLPIVAFSQLSRGIESRDNKRPMLSDFRDTGAWEEEADIVLALFREAYYLRRDKDHELDPAKWDELDKRLREAKFDIEIDALKVRQGEPKTIKAHIDIGVNCIADKPRTLRRVY